MNVIRTAETPPCQKRREATGLRTFPRPNQNIGFAKALAVCTQCPTFCAACRCREWPGARLSWHPCPSRSALPHTPRRPRAETSCPFSPPTGGRECREPARSVPQVRTRIPFVGSFVCMHQTAQTEGRRGGESVKNARDQVQQARGFCEEVKMGAFRL